MISHRVPLGQYPISEPDKKCRDSPERRTNIESLMPPGPFLTVCIHPSRRSSSLTVAYTCDGSCVKQWTAIPLYSLDSGSLMVELGKVLRNLNSFRLASSREPKAPTTR